MPDILTLASQERLRILADSINDSARMARTTLALVLLAAIYLGLTLLSATDENLFFNKTIALPQLQTGITIQQSYIFAPPIFLYLHLQALILLHVLARKIRTFERTLSYFEQNHKKAEEYLDWLSAFSFVQLYRKDNSIAVISRVFIWFATCCIPIVLLFLIGISFVRYQSFAITASHHLWFIADVAAVWWFNREFYANHRPSFRE